MFIKLHLLFVNKCYTAEFYFLGYYSSKHINLKHYFFSINKKGTCTILLLLINAKQKKKWYIQKLTCDTTGALLLLTDSILVTDLI